MPNVGGNSVLDSKLRLKWERENDKWHQLAEIDRLIAHKEKLEKAMEVKRKQLQFKEFLDVQVKVKAQTINESQKQKEKEYEQRKQNEIALAYEEILGN